MHRNFGKFNTRIVINVIEVHERQHARISPRSTETVIRFSSVEVVAQQMCCQASGPLIEGNKNDTWAVRLRMMFHYLQTPVTLRPTLEKRCPKVNIVEVQ